MLQKKMFIYINEFYNIYDKKKYTITIYTKFKCGNISYLFLVYLGKYSEDSRKVVGEYNKYLCTLKIK